MNPQKLQKRLESFKGWREQVFILALAERASPNACLLLESIELQTQSRLLVQIISELWQLILSPGDEEVDDELRADLSDRLVALIPDESAADSYGINPMRDEFALLELVLLAMVSDEACYALDASQQSLATITGFIEFSEGEGKSESELIRMFDQHPLVEREFSFQEELFDLLRAAQLPSADLIKSLRVLASDDGVSNIGICMEE